MPEPKPSQTMPARGATTQETVLALERASERLAHSRTESEASLRGADLALAASLQAPVSAEHAAQIHAAQDELVAMGPQALPAMTARFERPFTEQEALILLVLVGRIRGKEALDFLIQVRSRAMAMKPPVREAWIHAVGQAGGRRAIAALIPLLQQKMSDADWGACRDVILATGEAGDAPALKHLASTVKSQAQCDHLQALAEALSQKPASRKPIEIPKDASAQDLADRLRKASDPMDAVIIRRLGTLSSPEAASALADHVRTHPDDALNAIDALCGMKNPLCRGELFLVLSEGSPELQDTAIEFLAEQGGREDLPQLERMMASIQDPSRKALWEQVLEAIRARQEDPSPPK